MNAVYLFIENYLSGEVKDPSTQVSLSPSTKTPDKGFFARQVVLFDAPRTVKPKF